MLKRSAKSTSSSHKPAAAQTDAVQGSPRRRYYPRPLPSADSLLGRAQPVDAAGAGQPLELVLASVFEPEAGAFEQTRRRR